MKTIHITEGESIEAQGSPMAIIEYQREFATDKSAPNWYADYKAALPQGEPSIAWVDNVFLAKTLWAMAQNAARINGTPRLPSFEKWFDEHPDLAAPISVWKMEVLTAIGEELFRTRVEKSAEGDAGE